MVAVNAYDEKWPQIFNNEALIIRDSLGEDCMSIHHIGSTAVLGLAAKPKIDIIAECVISTNVIIKIENIGYEYRGEWNIPGKMGFIKRKGADVNLHVFPEGHPEVQGNLLFRDYLRQHERARDEYTLLKQKLLQDPDAMLKNKKSHNLPKYTIGKSEFILSVLKQCGFNSPRILRPSTDLDWNYLSSREDRLDQNFIMCYKGFEITGYALHHGGDKVDMHVADKDYKLFLEVFAQWRDNARTFNL